MEEYNRVVQTADSFYKAFERCMEQRVLSEDKFEILVVPGTVNIAFACELYLKAILRESGNKTKLHNLEKLYVKLPDEIKNEIEKNFNGDDFLKELKGICNAFVDWRYVYEKETIEINFAFLYKFAKVLSEMLKKNS